MAEAIELGAARGSFWNTTRTHTSTQISQTNLLASKQNVLNMQSLGHFISLYVLVCRFNANKFDMTSNTG